MFYFLPGFKEPKISYFCAIEPVLKNHRLIISGIPDIIIIWKR